MKQLVSLSEDVAIAIATTEEAAKTVDAIERIVEGKYKTRTNPFEEMKKLLPYTTASRLLHLYQEAEGSMTSAEELYGFLDVVKHVLQTLPTLSIQIAVTPTQEVLEHIVSWVSNNLSEPHLLQIVVKHALLGGAAIGYQGQMKDYSVEKKLPEILKN